MSILPEKKKFEHYPIRYCPDWGNGVNDCPDFGCNKAIDDCQEALDKKIAEASDVKDIVKDKLRNSVIAGDWDTTRALFFNEAILDSLAETISAHIKRTLKGG